MWLGSNVGACIMFMLEGLNELIKFSQSQFCFVCDFVVVIKFCQVNLHHQYNDLRDAYMNDVFNGYRNLLNGTSNVMVHEWAPRIWILVEWKQENQAVCGQSLKIVFWKLEKSPWDTIYQKINFFEINFYNFQVAITKFSWKFIMFQESFYMFKALKKSMWIGGFLYQKSFSLIKCSPNHFIFFVNFNIFHKKGSMSSKHSKIKYICHFRF